MTHPVRHPVRWLLLCALGALAVSALTTGCSSNGYSPSCPPLPLYNVHEWQSDASVIAARKKSESANCSTPIGDASSGATTNNPSPLDAGGG